MPSPRRFPPPWTIEELDAAGASWPMSISKKSLRGDLSRNCGARGQAAEPLAVAAEPLASPGNRQDVARPDALPAKDGR
jgi:hypothetical protein